MNVHFHRAALPFALSALLALAVVAGPQDAPEKVVVEVQPVQGAVSFLIGGIGNTLVSSGEQGVLVVDTKTAPDGDALDAALAKMSELLPTYVVNTHWHGDHTGNNVRYGKEAVVCAHENVRRRLAGDASIGGSVAKDTPGPALPEVTYEEGATLHLNGEAIRLMHFPRAHTDGDTVVWFTGSKVVGMGDLYFQIGYPFIDVQSGGSVHGVIAGIEAMLAAAPEGTRFVPGHGVVTGPEELTEYLEMLRTVTSRVEELVAAGMSPDEIVAARPSEDFDERWGHFDFVPPERFVRSILASPKLE